MTTNHENLFSHQEALTSAEETRLKADREKFVKERIETQHPLNRTQHDTRIIYS